MKETCRSSIRHNSIDLCLLPSTKETRWGDSKSYTDPSCFRFQRKSAFFTLVAAEAMTNVLVQKLLLIG